MERLADFHIITRRSVRSALRDLSDASLHGLGVTSRIWEPQGEGALLVARLIYPPGGGGWGRSADKALERALRLYGYHLILLTFAFTMAAAFAVMAHKLALIKLPRGLFSKDQSLPLAHSDQSHSTLSP